MSDAIITALLLMHFSDDSTQLLCSSPTLSISQTLFDAVLYYIFETLPLDERDQLSEVFDTRGTTPVFVTNLTITSYLALEDLGEAIPDESAAHAITPRWVERSIML